MENVILTVHLILALGLVVVVLLQRSEGGGLGMGGGGGGVVTGRQAATALAKLTWGLAVAFIVTSVGLTVLAARDAAAPSVVDGAAIEAPAAEGAGGLAPGADLLPPAPDAAPAAPARAD
jgi:preprotein translocase subunit SecG